jgi:hypothetical protein
MLLFYVLQELVPWCSIHLEEPVLAKIVTKLRLLCVENNTVYLPPARNLLKSARIVSCFAVRDQDEVL